jgi:hypothetical protein
MSKTHRNKMDRKTRFELDAETTKRIEDYFENQGLSTEAKAITVKRCNKFLQAYPLEQMTDENYYQLLIEFQRVLDLDHRENPEARLEVRKNDRANQLAKSVIDFFLLGRPNTIKRAPGYRILAAAEFLCSPKTIDQVFEPLIADWQQEYFNALNDNRWLKARWISIRYMWKAGLAFGLCKLFAAVRAFSTKR